MEATTHNLNAMLAELLDGLSLADIKAETTPATPARYALITDTISHNRKDQR